MLPSPDEPDDALFGHEVYSDLGHELEDGAEENVSQELEPLGLRYSSPPKYYTPTGMLVLPWTHFSARIPLAHPHSRSHYREILMIYTVCRNTSTQLLRFNHWPKLRFASCVTQGQAIVFCFVPRGPGQSPPRIPPFFACISDKGTAQRSTIDVMKDLD